MTFEPSPRHLGPFVRIHVFGKKHGDAYGLIPGPATTCLKPPLPCKSRAVLAPTVCLLSIGAPGPGRPPSLEEALQAACQL